MSKINNGGLDQYGAEQQQFRTAVLEGVKLLVPVFFRRLILMVQSELQPRRTYTLLNWLDS